MTFIWLVVAAWVGFILGFLTAAIMSVNQGEAK